MEPLGVNWHAKHILYKLAATREYHGTFRSPSSASRTKMAPAETPDVIMPLVSYFCGLPGVPRKARKIGTLGPVSPSKSQFAETI